MKSFLEVTAKSQSGEYMALIAIDHIGSILQSTVGCQIVCKNGDIIPAKDDFKKVHAAVKYFDNQMNKL